MNRVCKVLGITKPVVQGPMFWLTSPKMVAAISNAGGLGVLGICGGFTKPLTTVKDTVEEMRKQIRKTKELTDKPFGVNVFPASGDPFGFSKATLKLCKEEDVKILVAVGQTSPSELRQWKNDGFTLITRELNPTIRGAIEAEKCGADVIVATGCDEGGCMPSLTTGTLSAVALLKSAVKVPVLAAGGIINEKMAKATSIVGAEGAFVGTRFILSKESPSHQKVKEDIMNAHPDDLLVFNIFEGRNRCRTTPHKVGRDGIKENKKGNLSPPQGDFFSAMIKGNLDAGVNTVCNVSPLIRSIDSCKDIVNEIARGYNC